ncbi:MAG: JmjC domain-containing protein [Hyalangium sp.]|uniref:JmjC domain-containing protein n=1 Tax=Hyalangium sp. TaxID=2028555 RepID=UPI00389995BC
MDDTISLARLIKPLSVKQFMTEVWPHRIHVSHGAMDRFPELLRIPELQNLEALVRAYPERIPVWFPKDSMRDEQGRTSYGTYFDPRDALNLYGVGATLFFQKLDTYVPQIRAMARRLEEDLGFPPGKTFCSGFASRRSAGALPHFDPELNFAVQLRGSKRWRLALNEHVSWPPAGYGVIDKTVPETLRAALKQDLPKEMPENVQTVELRPGSVLFFPPGAWHATESGEESFHIVFGIWPHSWADLVLRHLRTRLMAQEAWREPAAGMLGPRSQRKQASQHLAGLLRELPEVLGSLQVEELLGGEAAQRSYQRKATARIQLKQRGKGAEREWLLSVQHKGERSEVSVVPELLPLVRWVLARRQPFVEGEALSAARVLPPQDLREALDILVETHVLELSDGPASRARG